MSDTANGQPTPRYVPEMTDWDDHLFRMIPGGDLLWASTPIVPEFSRAGIRVPIAANHWDAALQAQAAKAEG
jgi:hypothetical protein